MGTHFLFNICNEPNSGGCDFTFYSSLKSRVRISGGPDVFTVEVEDKDDYDFNDVVFLVSLGSPPECPLY